MPQVPRYSSQVRQQGIQGNISTKSPSLETLGGGQGLENITRAATGLLQTVQKEKENADDIAALDANNKLLAYEADYLYNPDTGAMNKKGKDSFSLPEQFRTDYTQKVSEIEASLSNDNQKAMFRMKANARSTAVSKDINKYVSGQMQEYDNGVVKAYVQSERDSALTFYNEPDRVNQSIQNQQIEIYKNAQRNGLPEEMVKVQLEEAQSMTLQSVISRYIDNGQDIAAKKYYEENKHRMTGAAQAQMEKALEAGTLLGESQRGADDIWNKSGGNYSKALEKASQIKDPKLRAETEKQIRQRQSDDQAALKDAQDDQFLSASEYVKNNPGQDPARVIPTSLWSSLTLQQQKSLSQYGSNPVNNSKAWLDFLEMSPGQMASLSRADFESKYWTQFDESHRSRAENMWKQSQSAKGNANNLTSTLTFKDTIESTARTAGLIPPNKGLGKLNKDEAERYARFEQAAALSIEDYERTELGGKRKATQQEKQDIVDNLLVSAVTEKGWFSDTRRFLFEVQPGEQLNLNATDIPQGELRKIRDYMQRNSIPYSDARALEMYDRKIRRMKSGN